MKMIKQEIYFYVADNFMRAVKDDEYWYFMSNANLSDNYKNNYIINKNMVEI